MKTIKTILNSVATLVVLLFVGIAAVSLFSAPKASGLFGYKNYTVVSGSMEPVLSPGVFIFVEMKPYQAVKEKDLITFSSNDEIVTHRVVRKSAEGWITKGDANTIEDQGSIDQNNYIGTVKLIIPYFGHLVIFLQKPYAVAAIAALIGLYLLIGYYYPISRENKKNKGSTQKQTS